MKRRIMGSLLLVIMFTIIAGPLNVSVQAAENNTSKKEQQKKYDEINKKYGLKVVSIIPKGIEPIKVNSPEELEKYIIDIQNQPTIVSVQDEVIEDTNSTQSINTTTYGTVRRSCSVSAGAPTIYVTGDIRVGQNSSFRWIDSVNTRVSWSGITTGLGISGQWSNSYINGNKTAVSVYGGATVDIYLLSSIGGVVLYSTARECSFNYSVY